MCSFVWDFCLNKNQIFRIKDLNFLFLWANWVKLCDTKNEIQQLRGDSSVPLYPVQIVGGDPGEERVFASLATFIHRNDAHQLPFGSKHDGQRSTAITLKTQLKWNISKAPLLCCSFHKRNINLLNISNDPIIGFREYRNISLCNWTWWHSWHRQQ